MVWVGIIDTWISGLGFKLVYHVQIALEFPNYTHLLRFKLNLAAVTKLRLTFPMLPPLSEKMILAHKVNLCICMLADLLLAGFVSCYIARSWKKKVITFSTVYRSKEFFRHLNPGWYWFIICIYSLLGLAAIAAFFRGTYELMVAKGFKP